MTSSPSGRSRAQPSPDAARRPGSLPAGISCRAAHLPSRYGQPIPFLEEASFRRGGGHSCVQALGTSVQGRGCIGEACRYYRRESRAPGSTDVIWLLKCCAPPAPNHALLLTRAAVAYQSAKLAEIWLTLRPTGKVGSRSRALTLGVRLYALPIRSVLAPPRPSSLESSQPSLVSVRGGGSSPVSHRGQT
jgi:hypothetical protein